MIFYCIVQLAPTANPFGILCAFCIITLGLLKIINESTGNKMYEALINLPKLFTVSSIAKDIKNNQFYTYFRYFVYFLLTLLFVTFAYFMFSSKTTASSLSIVLLLLMVLFGSFLFFGATSGTDSGTPQTFSQRNLAKVKGFVANNHSPLLFLSVVILLYAIYFLIVPIATDSRSLQGGTLLINQPVDVSKQQTIASASTLNGHSGSSDKTVANYNYGFSFWFYINFMDSNPSSTSNNGKGKGNNLPINYYSIVNYSDKPNILYNPDSNKIMIRMQCNDVNDVNNVGIKDYVYEIDNVLLQRWNNMIINYNSGILDIFYNGVLIKSVANTIPFINFQSDSLNTGDDNGISGYICNLVYYNKTLTTNQINTIYNSNKNKDPPVSNNNMVTNMAPQTDLSLNGYKVHSFDISFLRYLNPFRTTCNETKTETNLSQESTTGKPFPAYIKTLFSKHWLFSQRKEYDNYSPPPLI
jgi:hypothetical protein